MVHRYGRPYIPEQQHAPRQPAFWLPALSHPSRSQIIRSGDIMHTLLRRLSLFNATPDFSLFGFELSISQLDRPLLLFHINCNTTPFKT